MLAREAELTVIDFETTGSVRGYTNEPWQIGMVRFSGGRVVLDAQFASLLRVGERPFNPHAPGRHSELRGEIAAAPTLADLWPELSGWLLGRALVAHNVGTERTVFAKAAPLHRLGPWVDTLRLTRMAYPSIENHRLGTVVATLGLEQRVDELAPGLSAHDALYDALASGILLEHLLALPTWQHVTLDALCDCC